MERGIVMIQVVRQMYYFRLLEKASFRLLQQLSLKVAESMRVGHRAANLFARMAEMTGIVRIY